MSVPRRSVVLVGAMLFLTAVVSADTLYLRNGTRIQGELISVRGDVVEFEEDRGYGSSRRVLQIDREDVLRIELEPRRVMPPPGRGRGRGAGMRERVVVVTANVAWNDTGIDVRAGQEIYIEASGRVRWGRDRTDSPAGERGSPPNANRPMPNRPAAALIGKVGPDSTDFFFIGGEEGPFRIRASGRLFLGINDDYLPDNSGNFRVVVYY